MSGKHTPGPWLPSKFGFQVLTGDSWNTICTLKGGSEWEDGRGKYEQATEWENQEANARLIAAAPDLLDFVKWVADRGGDNNQMEIFQRARLLAAKAEGRAP